MKRPKRKNIYSLPRMTQRERIECLGWELLAMAVWLVAIVLVVGVGNL